jgi:REP element-mobilizing transposase RayT
MARGHERSRIVSTDEDRDRWIGLLGWAAERERWAVHGYCLMGNHFHLLVETPLGGISSGIHALNSRYAQWFNRRTGRRGHLFEGRFKAVLVQKQAHLLELSRYIVLNPVRARLVPSAAAWRWSSYRATAGMTPAPKWLSVEWTLSQFGARRQVAAAAYRRFVAQGKGVPSPLDGVSAQIYLGDERFLKEMSNRVRHLENDPEIPLRQRRPLGPSIETIEKAVAREWNVEISAVRRPRGGAEKMAAMYLVRTLTCMKVLDIAKRYGVKSARVSNVVRQVLEAPTTSVGGRIRRLEERLADNS